MDFTFSTISDELTYEELKPLIQYDTIVKVIDGDNKYIIKINRYEITQNGFYADRYRGCYLSNRKIILVAKRRRRFFVNKNDNFKFLLIDEGYLPHIQF